MAPPKPKVPEPALSKNDIFQGIRRFLSFLLVAALVISVFTHSGGVTAGLFQYHPIMVSCAFIGLLPEVMITVGQMKKGRVGLPRDDIVTRHQISTVLFNMCAIAGIGSVEYTKISKGYPHFTSAHGLVGTICGCSIVLQMVLGNLLVYVIPRRSSATRGVVKTLHGLMSMTICVTGLMCLMGGLVATDAAKQFIPLGPLRGVLAVSAPILLAWGYMG